MRKKYGKVIFLFLLFFLVFALGFFLPERLFAISDAKKMEEMEISEDEILALPGAEQISMEKKLQYLYQKENPSEMEFITAEASDEDWLQIDQIVQRELENLQKYHLLPANSAFLVKNQEKEETLTEVYDKFYKNQIYANKYFLVDPSGDGEFISLWFVQMTSTKLEQLYLWLDDESAKILSLGYLETKERKNRKKAKKRFRKYLREELSLATEEIPDFPFYADRYSYSICPDRLGEMQDELGFSDIYSKAKVQSGKNYSYMGSSS